MGSNQIVQFAKNLMSKNLNLSGSPMGQTFTNILNSGNASAGEELANNIISSMGISKEEAIKQAGSYFGFDVGAFSDITGYMK